MQSPITTRFADLNEDLFMPRELSWLSFNARVLQEAADEDVPVIQRLRYLGIFSNNLDEFFRVRVAEVRRLVSVATGTSKQQAQDLLEAIQRGVVRLQKEFEQVQLQRCLRCEFPSDQCFPLSRLLCSYHIYHEQFRIQLLSSRKVILQSISDSYNEKLFRL